MKEKRMIGCGLAVFVVVGLLAVVWSIMVNRPAAVVRGELARIAGEGSPLTLKDLDGVKIANEQNAAVVYERAFKLISGEGAKADMEFVSRAFSKTEPLKSKAEWAELGRVLAKYDAVVPLVEEAQTRPECRWDIGWQKKGALGVGLRHCPELRNIGRLLGVRAVVSARNGRVDEAVRCLEMGLRLSDALEYRPTSLVFLCRLSIIEMSCMALQRVVDVGTLSDAQARRLCEALGRIDVSGGAAEALKVDRASAISVFDGVREKGPEFVGVDAVTIGLKPFRGLSVYAIRCYADEGCYLKLARVYIDASHYSYREAVKNKRPINYPNKLPKYALLSAICIEPARGLMIARDKAQARINGSRIALALAVYHNNHKAYPASLKDISGFFGGKIPTDPFSGKDFVYGKMADGYTLYSIGPDLADQGGSRTEDMVWRGE